MRIGITVLSVGCFGNSGFYNLQEVGLAKALDKLCEEVKVYKLVSKKESPVVETISGTRHATIAFLPVKTIGSNGIPDMSLFDNTLDALVCFSDTQLMLPKVYRWAKKHNIFFLPYIGVTESHSTSKIKKTVVNLLFKRDLAVYRKNRCLVKTPAVEQRLRTFGVNNITVAHIGLDITLLKDDYEAYIPEELKKIYDYQETDKVLLFIGRLTNEKQPIRMIEIFSRLVIKDKNYKLLMIGAGELLSAVKSKIKELNLEESVQIIERIPNSEMWKPYRFAEALVNLNRHEIFGMAILEAMYYGCKVVAWEAPGPNLIIENGISGWLANSNQQVIEKIENTTDISKEAHNRILKKFIWENTADKIYNIIVEKMTENKR
jgi:1,2-diacylglycerol 3-alpha-glucosyltransferase